MKRYLLIFYGLGLMFILASCGDDPLPPATAGFSYASETENVPEIGRRIGFSNESTNFATLLWDFGNGFVTDSLSPSVIYEESGDYIVTLTAITADGQETVTSQDLVVGERVMKSLGVFDIDFFKQDGSNWDPVDPVDTASRWPDILFLLGPQSDIQNSIVLSSSVPGAEFLDDMTAESLPFGFELNDQGPAFILTDELWDILFLDDDGEDVDPELMLQGTFNPVFLSTTFFTDNEGSGILDLNLGGYSVEVGFKIEVPQQ